MPTGKRRGKLSAMAHTIVKGDRAALAKGKTGPSKPAVAAKARPLDPVERDAKIRELREDWKRELAEILETAGRRREREKPRKFQDILLWEMDQIRHAEAKYKSSVGRLVGGGLPDIAVEPKQPKLVERAMDKRVSGKMLRPRLSK